MNYLVTVFPVDFVVVVVIVGVLLGRNGF